MEHKVNKVLEVKQEEMALMEHKVNKVSKDLMDLKAMQVSTELQE